MLTFKQRYRPRTEREYTKTDLTVYDSAGNTALRGLKVYGKSEVVDGTIKSAGEGYAVVDLGTLLWYKDDTYTAFFSPSLNDIIKTGFKNSTPAPMGCGKYVTTAFYVADKGHFEGKNKAIAYAYQTGERLYIKDTDYTDATAFKAAMSGVILCYQLADPTQGNTIAIKTDNGTGIDGTMAVFETGTPLRGIPDTTVRDVMVWDGSAGEVTKKCSIVDLGTLNWMYATAAISRPTFSTDISDLAPTESPLLCALYTSKINRQYIDGDMQIARWNNSGSNTIIITNSNYTDAGSFKTAMSGVKLVYELATPTTEQLTSTENASIASLRTFDGTTHFTNNASTDMSVNYTIKVPTIS